MLRVRSLLVAPAADATGARDVVVRLGVADGLPLTLGRMQVGSARGAALDHARRGDALRPRRRPWPLTVTVIGKVPGAAHVWPPRDDRARDRRAPRERRSLRPLVGKPGTRPLDQGPHQSISCSRGSPWSLVMARMRSSSTRTTGSGNASQAKNALFSKPRAPQPEEVQPLRRRAREQDQAPAAEHVEVDPPEREGREAIGRGEVLAEVAQLGQVRAQVLVQQIVGGLA